VIGLAAMAVAALAADPAYGRVVERAKACISANAADVERLEPSLTAASDFIVGDVCAVPVAVQARYEASHKWLSSMQGLAFDGWDDEGAVADKKTAKAMKSMIAKQREVYTAATIREDTGDLVMPPGANNTTSFVIGVAGTARDAASPELRAFAAKTLLDARKARLARP